MREVEIKLEAPEGFELPDLGGTGGVEKAEERGAQHLRATYYDTSDLRLARNGITLRYRSGEDGNEPWTLKLPTASPVERDELTFPGGSRTVPAAALDLVAAFTRGERVRPAVRIETRRRRWDLLGADGNAVAEVSDDQAGILENGEIVGGFRDVEIESRGAAVEELRLIAGKLRAAGARTTDDTPKAIRALGERAMQPSDVQPPTRIRRTDEAVMAVRFWLGTGVRRLVVNDPAVRLGDEEAVHQMRVATRRLRSDLRTFAVLVEQEWSGHLRSELRWVGRALGEVRDLDVMTAHLRKAAGGLADELGPLFDRLAAMNLQARDALLEVLRSERYLMLLEELVAGIAQPKVTEAAQEKCEDVLPGAARTVWLKLARRGRSLRPGDPDRDFHRVRIRAKQVRYAAEASAPFLRSKHSTEASKFAARCADVQDTLGALQDAVVSSSMIRSVASQRNDDGSFNLALGRLLERVEAGARASKAEFPAVWERLDRPRLTGWLAE